MYDSPTAVLGEYSAVYLHVDVSVHGNHDDRVSVTQSGCAVLALVGHSAEFLHRSNNMRPEPVFGAVEIQNVSADLTLPYGRVLYDYFDGSADLT